MTDLIEQMADQVTTLRIENIEKEVAEIKPLVRDTHIAVIALSTKFDDGPGTWATCQQHRSTLLEVQERLAKVERRIFVAVGAVLILAPIATALTGHFIKKIFP